MSQMSSQYGTNPYASLIPSIHQPASNIADTSFNAKSLTSRPNFGELLQEELRQRLYLIRSALQRQQNDQELLDISNAFTNRSFKVFMNVVDIYQSFHD